MTADGAPLARDATAQTLNYALGNLGGKQKSWMVDASTFSPVERPAPPPPPPPPAPVRRRGRPRKDPVHTAQALPMPPSNSTSPDLANTVLQRNSADQGAPPSAAFPSPTPSADNSTTTPAQLVHDGTHARLANASPRPADSTPTGPAPGPSLGRVAGNDAAKRPPSRTASGAGKRSRVVAPGQERLPPIANVTRSRSPTGAGSRLPVPGYVPPGAPALPLPHDNPPSFQMNQHQHQPRHGQPPPLQQAILAQDTRASRFPPQVQAPFSSSQASSSHRAPAHAFPATADTRQAPPFHVAPSAAQWALVPAQDWYTPQDCMHVINNFHAAFTISPDHPRDGRRLAVLTSAVDSQDWPFLTMHQLYCLLDYDPGVVPPSVRSQPDLNQAMKILRAVLDLNTTLSPQVLHLFANFPYPLEELRQRFPAESQNQIQSFIRFVAHAHLYDQLKTTCERRRCPPLARELAVDLQIISTTFQRSLFTALFRFIWNLEHPTPLQQQCETEVVALFQKNQADHQQRIAHLASIQFPVSRITQSDKELELHQWMSEVSRTISALEYTARRPVFAPPPQSHPPASSYSQHFQAQTGSFVPSTALHMVPPVNMSSAQTLQHSRGRGQPRAGPGPSYHVLSAESVTRQSQAPLSNQVRTRRLLLPPQGWILPQQRVPNPSRFSLHQAHLRSPILQAQSVSSPLYHFMMGFIKPPARLENAGKAVERWTFNLTSDQMKCIPKTLPNVQGGPDVRAIDQQSRTVRLRCIKWPGSKMPKESAWVVAETSWIPYSYFRLNGSALEQRSKLHYGKDLSIDLTGLMREGENVLEVSVISRPGDTSYLKYLVAIEFLVVQSHKFIKRQVLSENRILAEHVLQNLKQKLADTSDDDEIAVVESNLTINLFDPFSASKICDIPVRGRSCLHNDCFDLETFLNTRQRKGDASESDYWRCPICNMDARPHQLLVDGFIEDVYKQFEARGQPHPRAIIVQQDGSWKPKEDVCDPNGVSDRSPSDEPTPPVRAQHTIPADIEVIDLCD